MLKRKLVSIDDLKNNFDLLKLNLSRSDFYSNVNISSSNLNKIIDLNDLFKSLIFRIESLSDFEFLMEFSNIHNFSVGAIEIKSNLLSILDFSLFNLNFIRIYVLNYSDIFGISKFISKFIFIEYVISYDLYSISGLVHTNNRNRVVIDFNTSIESVDFNKLNYDFISRRMFLFTKGIPFCQIENYSYCVELYNYFGFYNFLSSISKINLKSENLDLSCSKCIFKNSCFKNSDFNHCSITDRSSNVDVLKFLENERINDKF